MPKTHTIEDYIKMGRKPEDRYYWLISDLQNYLTSNRYYKPNPRQIDNLRDVIDQGAELHIASLEINKRPEERYATPPIIKLAEYSRDIENAQYHIAKAALLIHHGVSVNEKAAKSKYTALNCLVERQNLPLTKFFLLNGADYKNDPVLTDYIAKYPTNPDILDKEKADAYFTAYRKITDQLDKVAANAALADAYDKAGNHRESAPLHMENATYYIGEAYRFYSDHRQFFDNKDDPGNDYTQDCSAIIRGCILNQAMNHLHKAGSAYFAFSKQDYATVLHQKAQLTAQMPGREKDAPGWQALAEMKINEVLALPDGHKNIDAMTIKIAIIQHQKNHEHELKQLIAAVSAAKADAAKAALPPSRTPTPPSITIGDTVIVSQKRDGDSDRRRSFSHSSTESDSPLHHDDSPLLKANVTKRKGFIIR